jgi:ribosomal protein S12 methylthiotransferase accessory factor
MTLGVVGEGPAVDAVTAALEDVEREPAAIQPGDIGAVDLAVVGGDVGEEAFTETSAAARESGTAWLAVELGGLGGQPLAEVDAAVAGFGPGTACYDCLAGRVAANGESAGESGTADPTVARFAGAIAGREAARLLAGDDSTVLGGVIEVPHATRGVLPLPGCACAGERNWALSLAHDTRDLETALARAEQALDPRVGVVSEVGEAESFPVPYYLARLCDTSGFSDVAAPPQAAGVAAGWDAAFMKALGEAMERYSAGVYRTEEFGHGRPEAVGDAVGPSRFVTAPGFESPDPTDEIAWVPGTDLYGEGTVALPATFVQFPPPETRYRPATTTGLGLGNSTGEAVLSGLYEVVERDAAMLAWYSTYEPLGLEVDDEEYETLVRRAKSEGLAVTAMLLTQDVDVPVVAAAVHREGGEWPRFATGMDADLDPAATARAALEEALQNWTELRGMGREDAAAESGAIGRYADFPPEAEAFVSPESTVPAASVGPDSIPEGEAELDAVLDRLASAGLDAYAARLTPRDVEQAGFEAVRVLTPSAQPLFTDEPYFGERAQSVPAELGFEPRLDREHHPFP